MAVKRIGLNCVNYEVLPAIVRNVNLLLRRWICETSCHRSAWCLEKIQYISNQNWKVLF